MRRLLVALSLSLAFTASLLAQTSSPPPPQTARLALIEMFFGKGPDDFLKHLPEEARSALIHKSDSPRDSFLFRIAEMGKQLTASGQKVETFDVGPNILVSTQQNDRQKVEIAVEHDSLTGDGDEIELSVHYYKEGQLVTLPVLPSFIFTLEQQEDIWRLTEVTAAAHVPLTDHDYLKALRRKQDEANEDSARMRVTVIGQTEAVYATQHPERGFVCSLQVLFKPEAQNPNGPTAYNPGWDQPEASGYHFEISGCSGTPANHYQVSAVPIESSDELKTFCSDETGTVRFVTGSKASSCFSDGAPVGSGSPSGSAIEQ